MPRSRPAALRLAWALALLLAAAHVWRYSSFVLDDTYISLRYARNLVDGHGLVFNPGERVEGYTNFSFVLWSALWLKLGLDPILGMKLLLVAAALWTLAMAAELERALAPRARHLLAPLLLLPLEMFVYWSFCTMEAMLFAALLATGLVLALAESRERRRRGAAPVFVLLALTRPEGVFAFALVSGVFLLLDLARDRDAAPLRRALANGVVFGLLYGAYFLWRYLYYGSLLPNTYYAKVTGDEAQFLTGVKNLREFLWAFPLTGLLLALPALFALRRFRGEPVARHGVVAVYLVAVAYAAYVVAIGGDFMPFFRFFVPLLPLYAALLGWALQQSGLLQSERGAWAGFALWALWVGCSFTTEQPYRAFVAHRTALVGIAGGEYFKTRLEPDDLIAVNTAGSLPYYAERPTLDMLGLTDATIARRPIYIVSEGWAGHRRGWGEYVLARRPKVILWYNAAGSREPFYMGDHELADSPVFRFFYQLRSVSLPPLAAAGEEDRVAERFLGYPFGYSSAGPAPMGDLGLIGSFQESPFALTTFREGPIALNYFEAGARDAELWAGAPLLARDLDRFLDAAVARWREQAARQPEADAAERARIEGLCEEARRKVEQNDFATAKQLLATAAAQNERARSPIVYQYIANVAVLAGEPFIAIPAQKEALRLAPDSVLYRTNLRNLLTAPYKSLTREKEKGAEETGKSDTATGRKGRR